MKTAFTFVAVAAFAALGSAQMDTSKPMPVDLNYAKAASASNTFEIRSSRLALAKGRRGMVAMHARMMIKDHTAAQNKLKGITAAAGAPIKDMLMPDQQRIMAKLQRLNGRAFDRYYTATQISGHQKTLATIKAYLGKGKHEGLLGYARNSEPVVAAHLQHAKTHRM